MKKLMTIAALAAIIGAAAFLTNHLQHHKSGPMIAIANYGPHSSLQDTIKGIKAQLTQEGFTPGQTIQILEADVAFDGALIPQMISQLLQKKPDVLVSMTTPVTQMAKGMKGSTPLVFTVITDPVEAGLLQQKDHSQNGITGCSDQQDLKALLNFARTLLPRAKRVGLLYATGEANDTALVKLMTQAAQETGFQVVPVAVDHARDVPLRMQQFRDKVDLIYVGTSGPIQPALPAIISHAKTMNIPLFNANEEAVKKHQVLASFGVNYEQIGRQTGKLIVHILKGEKAQNLNPAYPQTSDHHGYVSKRQAQALGVVLPSHMPNVTIVE
jgi:putative ABC transport system substrate-binding protein